MKFAYCGYDFFESVFDAVVRENHELVELFTWPCDNQYDFNTRLISKGEEIGSRITLSPISIDDLSRLRDKGVELLISAAYPYKIPPWNSYLRYAVNFHPTLLPHGRGPWPLPWTILKGLKESGVTVHEVSEDWDAGAILLQESFPVCATENLETLSAKCQMLAAEMSGVIFRNIDRFWSNRAEQRGGSYWPMPRSEERELNWKEPVRDLDKVIRAFGKFDSHARIGKNLKYVQYATVWEADHCYKPGTVVHRMNKEIIVAALDGYVCIRDFDE